MEPNVATGVLSTMTALMGAEPEVAEAVLLAAIYARAVRADQTPQDVVDNLFMSVPDADSWPPLRLALLAVLEEDGGSET